jgi:N-acetylneuraminic acid mutarotase
VWTFTGNISYAREFHTASVLTNGKVLVTGGYNGSYLNSAELYDPATGIWTFTASMNYSRNCYTVSLLASGQVLISGGYNGAYLNSSELYQP